MKYTLIEMIGQLELSFLLAVESMLPWESINPDGYLDGRLKVRLQDETLGRQIRALSYDDSDPVMFANEMGARIEWTRGSGVWPDGLGFMLRALGGDDGVNAPEGKVLLSLDSDVFDTRIRAIDVLLNLSRFLTNARVPPADILVAVACIQHWSFQWHEMRCKILEKGDSKARSQQMQDWSDQMVHNRFGLREYLSEVTPFYDPRGSCFELTNMDGRSTSVSPIRVDWEPGKEPSAANGGKSKARKPATVAASVPTKDVTVTKVDADVLATLRTARIQGNELFLAGTLSKKVYDKVNAVLVGLGGKWHTGKQSHVFAFDPTSCLSDLLENGWVRTAKDYEFFPTPAKLVERMLDGLSIEPGMMGLEPQAGGGAIADEMAKRLGGKQRVRCYELWTRNVDTLRAKGFEVQAVDFLTVDPQQEFDIVALNPPFSGGRDVLHVTHALKFVKPGGWLTAYTSTSWRSQDSAANLRFRAMLQKHGAVVEEVESGAFADSGTNVSTLLVKMQVKAEANSQPVTSQQTPATFDLLAFM